MLAFTSCASGPSLPAIAAQASAAALNEIVNVRYGDDVSIRQLAEVVKSVVGYTTQDDFSL